MRTLVVGGGIAGQAVSRRSASSDSQAELTLVCGEPRPPYDRVALSTLLAPGADPETLPCARRVGTRTSASRCA